MDSKTCKEKRRYYYLEALLASFEYANTEYALKLCKKCDGYHRVVCKAK